MKVLRCELDSDHNFVLRMMATKSKLCMLYQQCSQDFLENVNYSKFKNGLTEQNAISCFSISPNCRKKKSELNKKQLQRRLGTVTKLAKSALINYDAYVQADAECKKLNLAKFKAKIQADMTDDSDDDNGNDDNLVIDVNILIVFPYSTVTTNY